VPEYRLNPTTIVVVHVLIALILLTKPAADSTNMVSIKRPFSSGYFAVCVLLAMPQQYLCWP
jgi:hypothetical protein